MNLKLLVAIVAIALLMVIGVFVVLGSSSKPGDVANNKTVVVIAPKTLVEVNDITGDPLVYDGLSLEVESQINEWVTKKSFQVKTTSGGVFGGGGKSLLVIGKNPFTLPQNNSVIELGLGEKVRIHMKGKVVIVNKDQLEKYLGENFTSDEFKLDDNNLKAWTLGPVLLLDSVEKL